MCRARWHAALRQPVPTEAVRWQLHGNGRWHELRRRIYGRCIGVQPAADADAAGGAAGICGTAGRPMRRGRRMERRRVVYAQQTGQMNAAPQGGYAQPAGQNAAPQGSAAAPAESWTCECGNVNHGKFCSECGKPRPAGPWTCSCGTVNTGKFCSECGKPRS